MFNFLFILIVGALSVIFWGQLIYLLKCMVIGAMDLCEDKEKYSDLEDKVNIIGDTIKELEQPRDEFVKKCSAEDFEKYEKFKKASIVPMVAILVIAPVYMFVAILGLIF